MIQIFFGITIFVWKTIVQMIEASMKKKKKTVETFHNSFRTAQHLQSSLHLCSVTLSSNYKKKSRLAVQENLCNMKAERRKEKGNPEKQRATHRISPCLSPCKLSRREHALPLITDMATLMSWHTFKSLQKVQTCAKVSSSNKAVLQVTDQRFKNTHACVHST